MHDVDPIALPSEFKGSGPKSEVGCLLLHSFTASPSEVRKLGLYLRNAGYSGIAPLLPGHGSIAEDLSETTWLDWYESAREGLIYLRSQYKYVFIIGVALGSVLASMLAASPERDNITGLILISPSQHAPSSLIINLLPFLKFVKKDFQIDGEEAAAKALKEKGFFFYSKRPTQSLIELYRIIGFTNKRLSQINQPTLIIYSHENTENTEFIINKLTNCPKIERFPVKEGGQWFLLSPAATVAYEKIDSFIESITGLSSNKSSEEND
ncbi:MAG: alpha/beta hydrolase [Candidatus Hodarchaeales archaeon]